MCARHYKKSLQNKLADFGVTSTGFKPVTF